MFGGQHRVDEVRRAERAGWTGKGQLEEQVPLRQRMGVQARTKRKIKSLLTRLTSLEMLQDPKGLIDVWTEDGVRLDPGRSAVVGQKAIEADNEKGRAEHPGFKVLSYAPEFKELRIADGLAYEWGEGEAKFKMSPEGPPVTLRLRGVRVLRRQSDGSWKFALTIWNQAEQQ